MNNLSKINSQCQTALKLEGFSLKDIQLNSAIKKAVLSKNYDELDRLIHIETKPGGIIFDTLKCFCPVNEIEFIISLRESHNEWEEDGIWHDDGSRILAFSLSLTVNKPEGGVLEFRKKGAI